MITRPIRADLRRILLSVPGVPTIKWETQVYKPVADVPYIAEHLDPITSTTETMGRAGKTEDRYLYRLDLYWPISGFVSDAQDTADRVRLNFWHGRGVGSATGPQQFGTILSSDVRPPLEGDVFTQFPIRINFYVRRPTSPVGYGALP